MSLAAGGCSHGLVAAATQRAVACCHCRSFQRLMAKRSSTEPLGDLGLEECCFTCGRFSDGQMGQGITTNTWFRFCFSLSTVPEIWVTSIGCKQDGLANAVLEKHSTS